MYVYIYICIYNLHYIHTHTYIFYIYIYIGAPWVIIHVGRVSHIVNHQTIGVPPFQDCHRLRQQWVSGKSVHAADISRQVCPMVCQNVAQCGAAFWGLVPDGEFPKSEEQTHVVQRSFTVQHYVGGPWPWFETGIDHGYVNMYMVNECRWYPCPRYIWSNVSSVQNPCSLSTAGEYTKRKLLQYIHNWWVWNMFYFSIYWG